MNFYPKHHGNLLVAVAVISLSLSESRANQNTVSEILNIYSIAELRLEDKSIPECLRVISAHEARGRTHISTVLLPPAIRPYPKATLQIKDATFRDVIEDLCRATGLKFTTTSFVVVLGQELPDGILTEHKSDEASLSPPHLNRIVLPKFELSEGSLKEALSIISEKSLIYDINQEGITFKIIGKSPEGIPITMFCYDTPIDELLRLVALSTGVRYRQSQNVVSVICAD